MRAAFVPATGEVRVGDFPIPRAVAGGDVVVRMQLASVCGSDLHGVFHGFLKPEGVGRPGYPGHEGVGVVAESRSPAFAVGDAVLTVPVLGGCFAQYQLIQDTYLVPLPPGGDPATLLMAQQYGTTLFAMRLFWSGGPTGTAVVMGAGSAGLFFVQLCRRLGFETIVVSDLEPGRLATARALGATHTVQVPDESLATVVDATTAGTGADLVIEAVGLDSLRAEAVSLVRNQGTIGCFGFPERTGPAEFPMFAAYRKSARIHLASGTQAEPGLQAFRDALEHIHDGTIDVRHCLVDVYPLEQTAEALQAALSRSTSGVKVTITLE
ncbi:MAG: zinc-binding dehydrogenase [Aeromicrobium sp.]